MKREIRFRAWIPKLGIMLNDITLYGNGQMGYDEDDFKEALPKDHVLDYDYASVIKNYVNDEGDEDFDKVMPVLLGEDWIWLDDNEFIPMQYTGIKDVNDKEIYEGDIIDGMIVAYCGNQEEGLGMNCGWYLQRADFESWIELDSRCNHNGDNYFIQGNIFENPELVS